MENEKKNSSFWWPSLSNLDEATETAKLSQIIAYWIGGSYLVVGYLSSDTSSIVAGVIMALMGIGILRNYFWLVPVVSSIGLLEASFKILIVLSTGRVSGLIIAGFILIMSIHGWRAWLARRKFNT
tara:strand:+ start:90 stop:467 length:378 start_codon:yes stop_codon:yes gene_type:complete